MLKKIYKMSAVWCMPCKTYAPIFEGVGAMEKYRDIEFKEFDADDDEEMFEKFNIRAVPTTIFLNENDEEIARVNGLITKENLIAKIEELR